VARKTPQSLLGEIYDGALDSSVSLPDLLRKCIALGGETRSERLRDWASGELMGYGPGTEVPQYRKTSSLLYLDGATIGARISGQQVPLNMIPASVRDTVRERMENIEVRQSVSELVEMVDSARRDGQKSVSLSPPLQQELVALINHELAAAERRNDPFPSAFSMPPSQVVERVYWQVGINTFVAMTDAVRTILVQLVAEIRSVTPEEGTSPSREAAEQAVDVAVYGKVRKLVISQVGPHGQSAASAGGVAATGGREHESRPRRWMWWIVGIATVGGAVATVLALVLS
jgi:hypothetical protein